MPRKMRLFCQSSQTDHVDLEKDQGGRWAVFVSSNGDAYLTAEQARKMAARLVEFADAHEAPIPGYEEVR